MVIKNPLPPGTFRLLILILSLTGIFNPQGIAQSLETERASAVDLRGQVRDETGAAVPEAKITVRLTSTGSERTTFTDVEGNYKVPDLTATQVYQVTAQKTGFAPQVKREIGFKPGERAMVDFILKIAPIKEEVTVIAAPPTPGEKYEAFKDVPATVGVITKEELEQLQPRSLDEALVRIPGINYLDEDGRGLKSDIGLRGLDPTRSSKVTILVDGSPINPSSYSDPSLYYTIPVQRIERIEVLSGAGESILYGPNTVGGVINIITESPSEMDKFFFKPRITLGSDTEQTFQITSGGANKNLKYLFNALRRSGEGFRDRDRFSVNDFATKLIFTIDEKSDLTFNFNVYNNWEQTPGGLTERQFRENPRQSQNHHDEFESQRVSADVFYKREISKNNSLKISIFGNFLNEIGSLLWIH